jgi:hypothetical protein
MVTARHSFTEVTIAAHRDVLSAFRAMPRLAITVAALLALQIVLELVAGTIIPRNSLLGRDILAILYYVLMTPFLIAVHRFIILGEVTRDYRLDFGDRRFQVFFGWAFVMFLMTRVPGLAPALPKHWMIQLLALVGIVAVCIFIVRNAILFPAIAVDAPGASPRNAFEDTRGHGWYIFFVFLIPFVPSLLVALLGGVIAFLINPVFGRLVVVVLIGAGMMLWLTMAVVLASRLYVAYGERLNQPA